VVNISKRTCCLGGAANVMRNIATCEGQVHAFGAIGNDKSGQELIAGLQEFNINNAGIVTSLSRRTTEKCRVIASAQQLLRTDFEDVLPLEENLRDQMVDGVISLINNDAVDAIIFDDYAKGVLSAAMLEKIIAAAKKRNVITILDPKPKAGGVPPVKGLTLLKPNRSEAFALSKVHDNGCTADPANDSALLLAAEKINEEWAPEYLLISLASQGMAIFKNGKLQKVIPTMAREVFDVSGAGDTVAAVCTMAMASGCDVADAAAIANYAAGVVVGKIGTAPVYKKELLEALN
jgi:D-beta-D-heptose 7-phosphate kinase/D-beta-D-heptose 1-phosphate adenosyltransferase